jgi:hypothetical protein
MSANRSSRQIIPSGITKAGAEEKKLLSGVTGRPARPSLNKYESFEFVVNRCDLRGIQRARSR